MDLIKLREFVKNKHANQTRKHGTSYYLHPFRVAEILKEKGYGVEYQVAGLFHDLLEDTETTIEELIELSSVEIASSVKLLTKEKGYKMEEYLSKINDNKIAKAVKLADRLHNLSETHLASKEFMQKYIVETEKWYVKLAANTPFEQELLTILEGLEEYI